jgi:hypothetical protein
MLVHPAFVIIAFLFVFFGAAAIVVPGTYLYLWITEPLNPEVLDFDFRVNNVVQINTTTILVQCTGNWTIKYDGKFQIRVKSMNSVMSYSNFTIGHLYSNDTKIIYPSDMVKVYDADFHGDIYLTADALQKILEDIYHQRFPFAFHFEGSLEIVVVSRTYHPTFKFIRLI